MIIAPTQNLRPRWSRKRDQPYRSGKNVGWIKVKTAELADGNRDRWECFRSSGRMTGLVLGLFNAREVRFAD